MSTALLSRHAECAFWLARYLERAESMARILEAQSSFQRARPDEDGWAWILALYSDQDNFHKKYAEATAENVIAYYVTWLENQSSILACIRSARENARALRPLISSDMWMQINDFYSRMLGLSENDFSETRLSRSCDQIKRGCYAEMGVAESTLYRDESWPFFRLGLFIERADQTSRLLDVQFAQRATGVMQDLTPEQNASVWNALLRSASAYHAFRRTYTRGFDPANVARFLMFDKRLPRSVAFCVGQIERMVGKLRCEFMLRNSQRAFEKVATFQAELQKSENSETLLEDLHAFNDWTQQELIGLTSELGEAFFGWEKDGGPEAEAVTPPQESSMSQFQSQTSP
ncbi:MAG: alpha-E domain-containing protein [Rhodomicrobiaceae bacterium]